MIQVSNTLKLTEITDNDQARLFKLMKRIYTPMYKHLWEDQGKRYLESLYTANNLRLELNDPNAYYYFVLYNAKTIGILRVIKDCSLPDFPTQKATKLHRIYIDPEVQGKGIGKLLLVWLTAKAKSWGSTLLWLEAMDTQASAIEFYKRTGFKISNTLRLEVKYLHEHLRGMYRMWKKV